MVTSVQKIGAGITALENAKSTNPTTTSLSRYANGVKSLSDLISVASHMSVNADGFYKRIDMLKADAKSQREKITAEINGYRGMSPNQKIATIRDEVAAQRRELRDRTSEERYAALSKLKAATDSITAVKPMYRSPNVMLARERLGTPERSRMMQQMATSGISELEAFAALAINRGDKLMGACVLARLDGMSVKDRKQCTVSRDEVASLLMSVEFEKASEAIRIAENRLQLAFNSNHAFELGKDNPTQKIGLALSKQNETGILDDDGEGEDDGNS